MAQSPEERRESVREHRKKHHQKAIEDRARLDCYVERDTKDALKALKKRHNLSNEGAAVDWAVRIALQESLSLPLEPHNDPDGGNGSE